MFTALSLIRAGLGMAAGFGGSVIERKPSFWSRMRESFGGGDARSVSEYLVGAATISCLVGVRQLIYTLVKEK